LIEGRRWDGRTFEWLGREEGNRRREGRKEVGGRKGGRKE
jgi:hypothetical protein